jgi:tyrosinase
MSSKKTAMYRWTARIRCNDQELEDSSFSVFIFVGEVPDDPVHWRWAPSCAGVCSVLAYSQDPNEDMVPTVQDFVQLNTALLKKRDIASSSLEPDVIVPYLAHNLQWRVQKVSVLLGLHASIHCG